MSLYNHTLIFFINTRMRCGEGDDTPLQYSCLENPMDGGAWQAAVHGVSKSWTRLSDFTFMHQRRKWQPTPVLLPGESQGRGSLVGCRLRGRTELDTTEATQQQQQQTMPLGFQIQICLILTLDSNELTCPPQTKYYICGCIIFTYNSYLSNSLTLFRF